MASNPNEPPRKVSISQRWDADFFTTIKKLAIFTGRSMTQLTVDGLSILQRLFEEEGFLEMKPKQREDFLVQLYNSAQLRDNHNVVQSSTDINVPSSRSQPGQTKDKIQSLLKNNPGKKFSTIDIAELLNVPQSTIRAYTRKLCLADARFQLIEGRPNFVYHVSE
ncbi:MAG: hypothetical protein ACXAB7_11245 [Candidatus Kariarchaeaceae archaeon]|jgi:hypothetical protein